MAPRTKANRDDLCTLLHQAAAGPARDAVLVEWMVNLGALFNQPTVHCRKGTLQKDSVCPRECLPNTMAVHSAAIKGYDDIVMILLALDNLMDLDTPTFHTKETIAHLAVKHGHWPLYHQLCFVGADISLKDGRGKHVWELTTDREWSRDIEAEMYARKPVRLNGSRVESSWKTTNRKRPEGKATTSLYFQGDKQTSLADRSSKASPVKKKSKKRGKKGKNGKASPAGSVGASSDSPPEENLSLLKFLSGIAPPTQENGETVEVSLGKAFARLRDPTIAATDKHEDAQYACDVIDKLSEITAELSTPSNIADTSFEWRKTVVSAVSQVIHMMQKFHQVDHAALKHPVLQSVRERCGTTRGFTRMVVSTAQLCVSIGRKQQACEVMNVLEKRFVKAAAAKDPPPDFAELVGMYSAGRESMGLGKTSSTESLRMLESYMNEGKVKSEPQQEP